MPMAIIVDAKATLSTVMVRIIGINEFKLGTHSRVARSGGGRAEIAMVLDTTGSMSGRKIDTLKTAARNLIQDTLKANNGKAEPLVKIGIVPFAQYVNVGVSRRNESWIDVPADYRTSVRVCTGKNKKKKCTIGYTDHKFYGCAGSRNYPYNVRDEGYSFGRVPGLMDVTCANEITDLTTNQGRLISAVETLKAQGWTYIGSGLAWGWRMLSPDAPLIQGVPYADMDKTSTRKFVILMTDGENTRAPSYPEHESTSNSLANKLTTELCENVKASKIQIFTVAFEVNDTRTLGMLESCATEPGYAFDARSSSELLASFSTISKKLSQLRIAE